MDERATGVVIRTRVLTESSLIVHWLATPVGRVATVAKGARRPKSPFRGQLDLFYLASFSFQRSRRSDLHTLRETTLQETFPVLRTDLTRLQQATYATALIDKATEPDTPLGTIYDLFIGFLRYLVASPANPFSILAFEAKILLELGLAPPTNSPRPGPHPSPGTQALLRHCLHSPWSLLAQLKPSSVQLQEIQHLLDRCFLSHFGSLPAGRPQLLACFPFANF